MKKILPALIVLLALSACVKADPEPEPEPEPDDYAIIGSARVFLTTVDQSYLYTEIEKGATLYLTTEAPKAGFDITIDPNVRYQNILGVGASFTDSSAYLINSVLSNTDRDALMEKLFSQDKGIGISFIRNPMGSSDFSRTFYSYDDQALGETDEDLSDFSIAHDQEDIIPLVKQALSLNPDLKVMMSPWSPPAWMKTSDNMVGGSLLSKYFSQYAQYFVKTIQAYQAEGIDLFAVTVQNEPLYVPKNYAGSGMSADQQANFIKNALKPAFIEAGLDTKILAYDHNWDRKDYPLTVLEKATDEVDGVAWHVYGGNVIAQTEVFRAYPEKDVYFTEASGGEWIPPFEQAFLSQIKTGIDVFRNYSRTYVLWNMALDETNGPVVPNFGRSTCRGVVTVDQQTKALTYNLDFYTLAHFSDFLQKDALRIDSTKAEGNYASVAFMNPDKTISLVMYNMQPKDRDALIHLGKQTLVVHMPAKAVATVTFQSDIVK
jgi:glucosylceramidase